jgi:glucose/arabinose dehydrogenase
MLRFAVLCVLILPFVMASAAGQTALKTERVASGLSNPVHVVAPPGDTERLFIVEQRTARVLILRLDTLQIDAQPFVNLSSLVRNVGNSQGLFGLAFHPDYASNGYCYFNYTRKPDGATMIVRYRVAAQNPDQIDTSSRQVVMGPIAQPGENHNGGSHAFSPVDGYLYIALGDGASPNDAFCKAQDPSSPMGKILRIDVDSGQPYSVPADNPFVGVPGYLPEIWAVGLRNPYRIAFDRVVGSLYVADVGEVDREEVHVQSPLSPGGENYGWPVMEGNVCNFASTCPSSLRCDDADFTPPVWEYDHATGCCIIGGVVYRGCAIPDLQGSYFSSDYCTGEITSFRYDGAVLSDVQSRTAELEPAGSLHMDLITGFGEDGEGEVYVIDYLGEIYRIVADAPAPATDLGFGLAGQGGKIPELSACGLLTPGNQAELRLRDALPNTDLFVVFSQNQGNLPFMGGQLVPLVERLVKLRTDANGALTLTAFGGGGPLDVFVQILLPDRAASQGFAFSNALQVTWQP